jgi:hypothetical protein
MRVGGPPCIANGVMDALSEFGRAIREARARA